MVGPFDTDRTGDLYAVLANRQRRYICWYLHRSDTDVYTADELATELVKASNPSGDRRDLEIALHHTHLPKLAESGLVEYDARTTTVRVRDTAVLDTIGLEEMVDSYEIVDQ